MSGFNKNLLSNTLDRLQVLEAMRQDYKATKAHTGARVRVNMAGTLSLKWRDVLYSNDFGCYIIVYGKPVAISAALGSIF